MMYDIKRNILSEGAVDTSANAFHFTACSFTLAPWRNETFFEIISFQEMLGGWFISGYFTQHLNHVILANVVHTYFRHFLFVLRNKR